MFLSHNPVTPLKTPPDSPLQPEPPQLLLCFALITQQQQSTEATQEQSALAVRPHTLTLVQSQHRTAQVHMVPPAAQFTDEKKY